MGVVGGSWLVSEVLLEVCKAWEGIGVVIGVVNLVGRVTEFFWRFLVI